MKNGLDETNNLNPSKLFGFSQKFTVTFTFFADWFSFVFWVTIFDFQSTFVYFTDATINH